MRTVSACLLFLGLFAGCATHQETPATESQDRFPDFEWMRADGTVDAVHGIDSAMVEEAWGDHGIIRRYQVPVEKGGDHWEFVQIIEPDIQDAPTILEGWYRNGKKVGVWISHHYNGKVAGMITYDEGEPTRPSVGWYESGALSGVTLPEDDKGRSPYFWWWSNGYLEEVGTWVDHDQEGRVRNWDEQGNLTDDITLPPEED